jgi:hypothetical protein
MKHLIPGTTEVMVFFAMAVLCTGIVAAAPKLDVALAFLSVPLFITCAVMGLHRNWKLAEVREEATAVSRKVASSVEEVA